MFIDKYTQVRQQGHHSSLCAACQPDQHYCLNAQLLDRACCRFQNSSDANVTVCCDSEEIRAGVAVRPL